MNTFFKVSIPSDFLFHSFYDTDDCTMMGKFAVSLINFIQESTEDPLHDDIGSILQNPRDMEPFLKCLEHAEHIIKCLRRSGNK